MYPSGNRRDRGASILSYFSKSSQQTHEIEIQYKIRTPKELTEEQITLGDHLRRRRLELGLYQKDVAIQIGVTASTIWNWEHGWSINKRFVPLIVDFLGYRPALVREANS